MPNLRKMLGSATSPYILETINLINTQSHWTVSKWSIDTVRSLILPIVKKYIYTEMDEIKAVLRFAVHHLKTDMDKYYLLKKMEYISKLIEKYERFPALEAGLKAVYQACASSYLPQATLSVVFYGTACLAYENLGTDQDPKVYDKYATRQGIRMLNRLRKVAEENVQDKVKVALSSYEFIAIQEERFCPKT